MTSSIGTLPEFFEGSSQNFCMGKNLGWKVNEEILPTKGICLSIYPLVPRLLQHYSHFSIIITHIFRKSDF
jgi:hypothetical protein